MTVNQPEFSVYLSSALLRSLEAFKERRGITSNSAAIVAILDDYLAGVQPTEHNALERLAVLEGK